MEDDYKSVTEISGDDVSLEQVERIQNRYCWAKKYCESKDILEVACGSGQGLGQGSSRREEDRRQASSHESFGGEVSL